MFFSSLVTLIFAATALATPFKKFDGLKVDVSAPGGSVSSVDELRFTATVTNTGAESVKILRYGTILDDKLPTKPFVVTKDGAAVPFTGIKISVSLTDIDDAAFTIIPAGESVTVSHEVSSLYDFASAGTGKYSFEPISNFVVAGAAEKVISVESVSKVIATSSAVEVEITGDIAKRELPRINKRATDICTTASKKTFIDASYTEGKNLAKVASSYVTSKGSSDTLYKSYFGSTATSKVTTILNAVANESSSSRTLSCIDSYSACSSGVIAYTVISTTNIYFCSIFFNEVATANLCSGTTVASRNVRGGTTLHELTHAVGDTDDVTYGCSADQALSDSNKIKNADNFNCFTTQVYQNTKC
ncbi:Deuterolysin metalloprotease family-domain-containing protein [Cyathus striatus]|nr:Deuterolysin metalloprotease family-domain-containing protein [Cyathus striatus]